MPLPLQRTGTSPAQAALLALLLCFCYSGCRQASTGTDPNSLPAKYGVPAQHFEYCELQAVQQQVDNSGGLASLVSVIRYWEVDADEEALAKKYPPPSKGHSIRKLRRIAIDQNLTAFALTMNVNPEEQLGEQLVNGRPVIVALELPAEGYPGFPTSGTGEVQSRTAVVFGQSRDQFLVMDPGYGVVRMPKDEFEKLWVAAQHAALILSAS